MRQLACLTQALRALIASCLFIAAALPAWAATTTLNPIADAYVQQGTNAGINFGANTALNVATYSLLPNQNYDSYLKFDTASVSGIVSAKLRFYAKATYSISSVTGAAYAVSDTGWSETGITWNNKPARGGSIGQVTVNGTSNAWYEIDVTAYVQTEFNAGRKIVSLALHIPSSLANGIIAQSREGASKPELLITDSSNAPPNGSTYTQTATRVSSFTYESGTGLIKSETVEPDNAVLAVTTSYTYDAYGNKATVTAVAGATASAPAACGPSGSARTSQTAFSIGDSVTPAQTTSQNTLCHSETTQYHLQYGTPTQTTGPNGLSTAWAYDEFARKIAETRADGGQTLTTYGQGNAGCPTDAAFSTHTRVVHGATQLAPESYTCSDNLGRELRSATQAMDGRWIFKDTHYDALGQVSEVSQPYFDNEGPQHWIQTYYDELGRVISKLEPRENGAIAYSYTSYEVSAEGDPQITTTNPKGQTQTTVKNSQGWVIRKLDTQGNLLTHGYDAHGNLTRTVDAAGNVTTVAYDTRGRKTGMVDPDMGAWSYVYNAFGEMTSQTDAKNQTTTLTYDKLGRLTQKSSPDLITTWTYDKYQDGTTCNKGVGKLCEMTAGNGSGRKLVYDALGRAIQTLVTVAANEPVQTFSTAFDAQGRVDSQTWPTGVITKTLYSTRGHAVELKNAGTNQSYWRIDPSDPAAQDPYGHIQQETLGNNIVQTRYYQRETGWIYGAQAGSGAGVQNYAFQYDQLGNITARFDGVRQLYEYFQYDTLNRLTRAERNTTGGGTVVITAAYNAIGNITNKSDVGDYSYGAQPHAVASVAGLVNASYSYDANGNLTAGNNRTVTWTDWNMPASISQGANTVSFVYDGDRDRIQQVTPTGIITYLRGQGLFLEKTVNTDGSSEYRHYLNAGGRLIAIHTTRADSQGNPTTADTHYFHPDHLGSIAVVTDEAGAVIARYDFDPWGKRALVAGANVERRGFTGHEELEAVGLVHMNGRIYDPILGRFLSADPHIDGTDLQAFNRYTYVGNNPLTFTDPTGYFKLFGMKWSAARDQVVKPIVAMVVAWYLGPAIANSIYASWAIGAAQAAATAGTTLSYVGVASMWVGSNVISGAVVGMTTAAITDGDVGSGMGFGALSGGLFNTASLAGAADSVERVVAHAVAGCVSGAASGGKCGAGAASGAFGKLTTIGLDKLNADAVTNFVASTVAGGTAAVLGGGKFGNGAVTAAFGYLYNRCSGTACLGGDKSKENDGLLKTVIKWINKNVDFDIGVRGGVGVGGEYSISTTVDQALDKKFEAHVGGGEALGLSVAATADIPIIKLGSDPNAPVHTSLAVCGGGGFGGCVKINTLDKSVFSIDISAGFVGGFSIQNTVGITREGKIR